MKLPTLFEILTGHDTVRTKAVKFDELSLLYTWKVNCFCGKEYDVTQKPEERSQFESLDRGRAEHMTMVIESIYDLHAIGPEEDPDRQEPCVYCGVWKEQRSEYGCLEGTLPHKFYSDHPDDTGPWDRIQDVPENRKVEGRGGVVFYRRSCFPQEGSDYYYFDGASTSPEYANNYAPFSIWGGWESR